MPCERFTKTRIRARAASWLDKVDPTTMGKEELAKYRFLSSKYVRFSTLMSLLANRLRLTPMSQRDVRNSRAMMGTDPTSPDKPWDSDDVPARKN